MSKEKRKKFKRTDINDTLRQQNQKEKEQRSNENKFSRIDKSKYVGLDCEMVGTGEDGKVSNLENKNISLSSCSLYSYLTSFSRYLYSPELVLLISMEK